MTNVTQINIEGVKMIDAESKQAFEILCNILKTHTNKKDIQRIFLLESNIKFPKICRIENKAKNNASRLISISSKDLKNRTFDVEILATSILEKILTESVGRENNRKFFEQTTDVFYKSLGYAKQIEVKVEHYNIDYVYTKLIKCEFSNIDILEVVAIEFNENTHSKEYDIIKENFCKEALKYVYKKQCKNVRVNYTKIYQNDLAKKQY